MNLKEERYRLTIEPKTEVETAYVEEVLGLRKDGDFCKLVRKNAMGLSCIAYLETKVVERGGVDAWKPKTLEEFITLSSTTGKYAEMIGSYAQRMFKYASSIAATYHTEELLRKQLTVVKRDKNYLEAGIICMLLEELAHDKKA